MALQEVTPCHRGGPNNSLLAFLNIGCRIPITIGWPRSDPQENKFVEFSVVYAAAPADNPCDQMIFRVARILACLHCAERGAGVGDIRNQKQCRS